MLSLEESNERFDDNNQNKDEFVTWEEYKESEFKDPEEKAELENVDANEKHSMIEGEKFLFFVS